MDAESASNRYPDGSFRLRLVILCTTWTLLKSTYGHIPSWFVSLGFDLGVLLAPRLVIATGVELCIAGFSFGGEDTGGGGGRSGEVAGGVGTTFCIEEAHVCTSHCRNATPQSKHRTRLCDCTGDTISFGCKGGVCGV